MPRFYDFFAGAGLAGLGLGPRWQCVWANDVDEAKRQVYAANFGEEHFVCGDVAGIQASQLPVPVDMAWASFPCQDLSLAGWRRGISADRSGTFWAFWRIMRDLMETGGRPPVIVIENVAGLLYGDSFIGFCEALTALNMQFGALLIDAKHFLPQSRPRVFVVCVDSRVDCSGFVAEEPAGLWAPKSLLAAHGLLGEEGRRLWRWWSLPCPSAKPQPVNRLIERDPGGVEWHTREQTARLLAMMNERNRAKVDSALAGGKRHVGFLYKRMRDGVQRAEVRFDGISGCLRTPAGGSSRQTVVEVDNKRIRTRLLAPREAARLMGAPDSFILSGRYNHAYKAMGDGVAVPAVRWLSEQLLLPLTEHVQSVFSEAAQEEDAGAVKDKFRKSSERRAAEWRASVPFASAREPKPPRSQG